MSFRRGLKVCRRVICQWGELVRHDFVLTLAQESAIRVWFGAELAARALPQLSIVVETAPRDVFLPLVLTGVGASVLPESEARTAERLGAIVRTLGFVIPRTTHLFHRRDPLSPAAQAFTDLAQEETTPPATNRETPQTP